MAFHLVTQLQKKTRVGFENYNLAQLLLGYN